MLRHNAVNNKLLLFAKHRKGARSHLITKRSTIMTHDLAYCTQYSDRSLACPRGLRASC